LSNGQLLLAVRLIYPRLALIPLASNFVVSTPEEPDSMQELPLSPTSSSRWRYWLTRMPAVVLATALLAWIPGCPDSSKNNVVSGKVTLGDKPVAGEVIFTGPDNKVASSPILDGKYSIVNPPMGMCKITLKGGLAAGGISVKDAGKAPPDSTKSKEVKMPEEKMATGVPPPKKYENPETSGLTYEVKPGKHEKDIPLSQ